MDVYVTDYVRNTDLVSTITIRKETSEPYKYIVPHCYAELSDMEDDLGITVSVNLR